MIASTSVLGFAGYKNCSKDGGAMKQTISECLEDQIVIHVNNPSHGRRWARCNPVDLATAIQENHFVYEVLHRFPLKLYFDIDMYRTPDSDSTAELNGIKNMINTYFPNAQFAISGSISETKTSYHIIVPNYLIQNIDQLKTVKSLVHDMHKTNEAFDTAVYHLNRFMKCVNQSKTDGRIQSIIEDDDIRNHLITCFHTVDSMHIDSLPEEIVDKSMLVLSAEPFNLGTLPKVTYPLPKHIDPSTLCVNQILQLLPNTTECTFEYRHLVARYCFGNSMPFNEFFRWVVKKLDGRLDANIESFRTKWNYHWSRLNNYPQVTYQRILYILRYFYPTIGKDVSFRLFCDTFTIPQESIQKVDILTQEVFHHPTQAIILNTGMGSGKTTQTIEYIKHGCPSFLWITSNIALALNTLNRFEQSRIDVAYYKTFTKKTRPEMNTTNRLIICLNSMIHIDKLNTPYLIIDEIETLLNKFEGEFMKRKATIWNIFVRLLTRASKIILLDAFITTKTIQFLQSLNISYTIIERLHEPVTREIEYMTSSKIMIHDIIQKVSTNKKVVIFYPYKTDSKKGATNPHISVDTLVEIITKQTGKKGIGYHSDTDDKIKKTLKTVNTTWDAYDFVVSNNVISCGLSYENQDYSYMYMFIASFNLARDMVQFSYRVRSLLENKIYVSFIPAFKSSAWVNDCDQMADPIYTQLYNNVITEYKAPVKESFGFMCTKANYKQQTNTVTLSTTLNTQVSNLITNHLIAITWKDIPTIDYHQAETIKELCTMTEASLMDKYTLSKYYFRNQFIDPDSTEEMLETLWNERCNFFLIKLKHTMISPTNLFKKLQIYNRLDGLFPTSIDGLKTTPELINLIFKQFTFRSTNKTECSKKILKDVYNSYFNQQIIISKYNKDTKNTTYTIDPLYNVYYAFCLDNLRITEEDVDASNLYIDDKSITTTDECDEYEF